MTSLTRRSRYGILLCAIGLPLTAFIVGCKEEEPPPPPPPPPPAAPATVDPTAVAEYLTLDPKVSLQNAKPMQCSEDEVKAMLEFMSDFAAGNAEGLRSKMDTAGKKVLDGLVENGQWAEETARILEVDLIDRVAMPMGGNVFSFSVVLPRAERVQQDWLVTQRGDTFTFAPFAVPPVSKQVEEAIAAALDAANGDEAAGNQPEDDRDRNRDPRRRVPQPTDPSNPPPGKGPGPGSP